MIKPIRIPVTVEEYLEFFLNGHKTEVKESMIKSLLSGPQRPEQFKFDVCVRVNRHPKYNTQVGKTIRHEIDSWLIHNRHKFAVPA